jgi:hypothetical protein
MIFFISVGKVSRTGSTAEYDKSFMSEMFNISNYDFSLSSDNANSPLDVSLMINPSLKTFVINKMLFL